MDTPILTPFEIGASARPFYTHHNSLNMDMVLRIETELYLKRLIVGGMDRVYEVGRIFRNEGMDPKHNPEFTSIELYQAFTDFHGMMDLVEELYKRLAQKICGSMVIPYQGKQIDMGHWERLTMMEAVKKYSGVDFNDWKTDEDAIAAAKEHHVELPEVPTKGAILAEFFDAFVEDKLIQPTFIYDYPVEISPLAKRKPDDPAFTERFEYFIDCTEYGNAFSELNDPIDQKGRFERQVAERKAIEPDCKAQVDYDYVNALSTVCLPTGGLGFGVDRLVMLLTDSASIRDVLLFPHDEAHRPVNFNLSEKKARNFLINREVSGFFLRICKRTDRTFHRRKSKCENMEVFLHLQNRLPDLLDYRNTKFAVFFEGARIPSPGQRTSPSGLAGVLALMSARMALMTASFSSTVPNLVGSIAIMIWVRPISSPKVPMVWTALPPERRVAIRSSRMERPLPFQ